MCIIQINFTFVWNKYYNIIMLSIAERHKHILDKLNAQGFVKVLDIARELDVTPETIRKGKRTEISDHRVSGRRRYRDGLFCGLRSYSHGH